jgi:two-component system sensor histidine kinase FlrB
MSASLNTDTELQQLAEAFDTFNLVSSQLEASYSSLESRMTELRAELHSARAERRAANADNRVLEQRITGILDALPGGVVVIDRDGRVTNANPRAQRWLPGLEPGVTWTAICSELFEDEFSDHGDLVLRSGQRFIVTQEQVAGSEHIILLTDVTEQRQVDEVLARHRRLAGFGDMLATLAHQMRTPITAALLYATNARSAACAPAQRDDLLEKATRCLRDLETLISDMLTFARGNSSHGERLIDIAELLSEVERTVIPLKGESQTLTVTLPDASVRVLGNPRVLASAIENLVVNAFQSAGRDAVVRVSTQVVHGRNPQSGAASASDARRQFADSSVNKTARRVVCIEVQDNGPGVPKGDEDRIFEPFFSGRSDGTGLGLAAARSIIHAHGGSLVLSPEPEGGACFKVTLPMPDNDANDASDAEGTLQ